MATKGPRHPSSASPWGPARLASSLAIAQRHARFGARRMALAPADQEDLRQDILLALLERSARFDATRGAWGAFATVLARHAVADRARAHRHATCPAFLAIDLDSFPAGASATQHDVADPEISLDLRRVGSEIPASSGQLLTLLCATADIADAQRRAPASCAAFYRAVAELRCWLHAAGLRPPRAAAASATHRPSP